MIVQLLTVILFALPSIKGRCEVHYLPKVVLCRATINCTVALNDISRELRSWECLIGYRLRKGQTFSHTDFDVDNNYELYIQLQNADRYRSSDPLIGLRKLSIEKIRTLSIIGGNIIFVAPKLYELNSLKEFVIVNTMIEKVNLTKLSDIPSLTTLNVSRNRISTIELPDRRMDGRSNIHTIDLSHNRLSSTPDCCFSRFSRLLYLDLSYNLLKKMNKLSFKGMGQIETLLISHNKLKEVDFAIFAGLKILNMNHNELTSLRENDLKTLINLEQLDMSSNKLQTIEERSFSALIKLQKINLSHNQIKTIHKSVFKNNINLRTLHISANNVDNMEDGVFEGKNITDFSITGNNITRIIKYTTFRGIHVDKLDLSGAKITTIADKAFSDMGSELRCLNLSRNIIETMSKTSFKNLTALSKLDLSDNKLVDLDFNSEDLKELTEFYLQKNNIKTITASVFKNLASLLILDVSQNAFEGFEENLFAALYNIEKLILSNNDLHFLDPKTFTGLEKLKKLELLQTKIIFLQNTLLEDLISLEILNISHSQLDAIEYKAFDGTGRIKILDISFNFLENFSVNTYSFLHLRELYLNNNKLKNISELIFTNITSLKKINLSHNNILHLYSRGLRNLKNLNYVKLNSNINLKLESDTFNNLQLSELSLDNIQSPFSFDLAKDASITTLTLSNCNISNVDIIFVYNIKKISKLTLRSNLLTSLSKESFKRMPLLNSLDLSQNKISFIQPGTFLHTDKINTLYLNENNLQTFQFGSLEGLRHLRMLNLSSNAIQEFDPDLLRKSVDLSQMHIENNDFVKIDFKQFAETSVTTLYIGQNPIACEQLTILNRIKYGVLHITANHFDFNTENVDGIPCVTYFSSRKEKNIDILNKATDNLSEIEVTIKLLQEIFTKSYNETKSISKTLKEIMIYLPKDKNELREEFNVSQSLLVKYLQELLHKHDFLRTVLINSNNNITEAFKAILLEFNNNYSILNTNLSQEYNTTMIKSNNDDKKAFSSQLQPNKDIRNDTSDIKLLLYAIAACLAIQTLVTVLLLFHKCFLKNRRIVPFNNGEHESNLPLNFMETKL